jgi:hypothetical protein
MKVDRKQIEAYICVAALSVVHKRKLIGNQTQLRCCSVGSTQKEVDSQRKLDWGALLLCTNSMDQKREHHEDGKLNRICIM